MKYIINLTIIFDPKGRELVLKNDSQLSLGLSKPATRLLNELVNNSNIDLSRDQLIKRVWEDYGFSPSNATLNNHISELRKAFESLGANKDIIITLPRLGFRLQAEIYPIVLTASNVNNPVVQTENTPLLEEDAAMVIDASTVESSTDNGKKIRGKNALLIIGLIAVVTIAGLTLANFFKKEARPSSAIQNKCNIYNVDGSLPSSGLALKARKMIIAEGIDCSQEETDVYYAETRPDNEFLRVFFMAVCVKSDDDSYNNCINYKIIK